MPRSAARLPGGLARGGKLHRQGGDAMRGGEGEPCEGGEAARPIFERCAQSAMPTSAPGRPSTSRSPAVSSACSLMLRPLPTRPPPARPSSRPPAFTRPPTLHPPPVLYLPSPPPSGIVCSRLQVHATHKRRLHTHAQLPAHSPSPPASTPYACPQVYASHKRRLHAMAGVRGAMVLPQR
jgi:hypothetical protein